MKETSKSMFPNYTGKMGRHDFGVLLICSLPLVAAVSSLLSSYNLMGFQLTGFVWPQLFILSILYILYKKRRVCFPFRIWLPWALYLWLAVLWRNDLLGRYTVQNAFQITTPLVVGAAASVAIVEERTLLKFLRSFRLGILALGVIICLFELLPVLVGSNVFGPQPYGPRPAGLTIVIVVTVYVSNRRVSVVKITAVWFVCLIMAYLTGGRMATLATLSCWVAVPGYERRWYRPLALAIIGILALGIFYTPHFQDRFFRSGQGSLVDVLHGRFDTQGRLDGEGLWQQAINHARENIVFGGGSGYLQEKMGWKPVNDYLRILADYGVVGLFLFLGTVFIQLKACLQLYHKSTSPALKWAFGSAFAGLCLLLVITLTENSITYCLYLLNPLFGIIGAGYGVMFRTERPEVIERQYMLKSAGSKEYGMSK